MLEINSVWKYEKEKIFEIIDENSNVEWYYIPEDLTQVFHRF